MFRKNSFIPGASVPPAPRLRVQYSITTRTVNVEFNWDLPNGFPFLAEKQFVGSEPLFLEEIEKEVF